MIPAGLSRGWLMTTAQAERPPALRYNKSGIHDHHFNAARTDEERAFAREHPDVCYDDERCWWEGGIG
jgi:hypothetical protein